MVVLVVLTMVLGMLVALLMIRVGKGMRILVSVGLLLAWAMPPLAATTVWGWMFDTQYGVVNSLLTTLTGDRWFGHSWLIDPMSFFLVADHHRRVGACRSSPSRCTRASLRSRARCWRPHSSTVRARSSASGSSWFPTCAAIITVLVVLSMIWDLRLFTQVFVLQDIGGDRELTNRSACTSTRRVWPRGTTAWRAPSASSSCWSCCAIAYPYVRRTLREEEQ